MQNGLNDAKTIENEPSTPRGDGTFGTIEEEFQSMTGYLLLLLLDSKKISLQERILIFTRKNRKRRSRLYFLLIQNPLEGERESHYEHLLPPILMAYESFL